MSEEEVRAAFHNQVQYCTANGAPITGRICEALINVLDSNSMIGRRVLEWQGKPLADALPLRLAGGLHGLRLAGDEPALAPLYAGEATAMSAAERIVGDALAKHETRLLPWLDGPPQTNEAGRSSNFAAAMLWLADQGLPPRFECLEIGSSAGINLMMNRYHYDLGGVEVGPQNPAIQFTPDWRGDPPPDEHINIIGLRGCDVNPVDLTDPSQAARLKAYIWPEHTVRFGRFEAAVAAAQASPPALVEADAAEFVEAELAEPQQAGTTRLLMHSIVWQYVPETSRKRVKAAMAEAGSRASTDKPLAWIMLESNRENYRHELRVRHWPGSDGWTMLGTSHAHGAWVEWNPPTA